MKISVALVLLGVAAPHLAAQQVKPDRDGSWIQPVARYGKWLGVTAAAVLTALAMREHKSSDEAWNQLLEICRADNTDCALQPDGSYINPVSESFYQRSLYYDARARQRLMFGQIALAVSAAFFIYDLSGGPKGPPNIPLDPNRIILGPSPDGRTNVGLRLDF